jgi:hypothetical protein
MAKPSEGTLALAGLAIFAFWLFAMLPFLYGPPPRFAEASSPPQSHADQAAQQAAAKPDGSIAAPFFIRIPKTAKEKAEEAADRHEKSSTDRWVMIFTGAVALFNLLLVGATVLLYRAGEKQLNHLSETAERQLRAYVLVDTSDIRLRDGHTLEAFIFLKNFGQTPAYDVKSWVDMRVAGPQRLPFDQNLPFGFQTMIGPGGNFIIGPDQISISAEVPDQIKTGTKVIFVWGEVSYRDTFGKRWIFRFYVRNSKIMMNIADGLGVIAPGWAFEPYPDFGYQEHEVENKPEIP